MRTYDVFISYAIEDKEAVAGQIVRGLRQKGLNVYFVSDELAPGKSVTEVVYRGLEKSKFYILVLSPDYMREWPIVESNYIIHREKRTGRILAFPVWHRVEKSEVAKKFPALLDRYAAMTDKGISVVIESLYVEIKKANRKKWRGLAWRTIGTILLLTLLAAAIVPLIAPEDPVSLPSANEQEVLVRERIDLFEQNLANELLKKQAETSGNHIGLDSLLKVYNEYLHRSFQSRNDFIFSNGYRNISGRTNIENLGMSLAPSPHGAYGMDSSCIRRLDHVQTDSTFQLVTVFCNSDDAMFSIDTVFANRADSAVHMCVSYRQNIRMVYYTLHYSFTSRKMRQHVRFLGFKPKEEFVLDRNSGSWTIREIK